VNCYSPLVTLWILLSLCVPAIAEQEADLEAYCLAVFGEGVQSGFDLRDTNPLCTERDSSGLGLLHHRVDAADICQAQFGTARFQIAGRRIMCLDPDEKVGRGVVDLAQHCEDTYGPDAILSHRLSDGAPLCTVKAGHSQTHHAIDLAALCRAPVDPATVASENEVDCAAATQPGETQGDTGSGAPPPNQEAAGDTSSSSSFDREVPETAILRATPNLDLTDCGLSPSPVLEEFGVRAAPPPGSWMNGEVETPCPALTRGFRPDLGRACALMLPPDGVPDLVAGRPICRPPGTEPQPEDLSQWGMILPPVCTLLYPRPDELVRGELDAEGRPVLVSGQLVPGVRLRGGIVECFYIDIGGDDGPQEEIVEVET